MLQCRDPSTLRCYWLCWVSLACQWLTVSTALGCMGGSNETFPGSSILLGGWDDNTTIPKGCSSACCLCSGEDPELSSWDWGSHLKRSSHTTGACGPPPRMTHSQPFGVEQLSSFPVGSRVTYTCLHGAIRIPGLLDTVQCLPGSRWSELRDPCGRKYPFSWQSCLSLKASAAAALHGASFAAADGHSAAADG